MATFTYTPDFGAQKTTRPAVRSVKFGDGYEQRLTYGLNTQPQSWNLTFSVRDDAEANGIESFLATEAGVGWFYWTPPGAAGPLKFVCREWQRSIDRNDMNTVSATFDEVFDL